MLIMRCIDVSKNGRLVTYAIVIFYVVELFSHVNGYITVRFTRHIYFVLKVTLNR